MSAGRIRRDELFARLPAEWPTDLRPAIQAQVNAGRRKIVVLDDDPTGTQTVHGVPVLTQWPVQLLQSELENDRPALYILTNSRSLPPASARALNTEIGRNLTAAARLAERKFVVVSRSDSTLRGHFPAEVEALDQALGTPFDGWIVAPFFLEGGRYTMDDIHYAEEEGWLTPAGETPFARDSAFGYQSSNLRQWVEEKTAGRVTAGQVASIPLGELRQGGPSVVTRRLLDLTDRRICVVNGCSYRDMEVFVQGLLAAEAQGKRFLCRTAASFVQVRAGQRARPLLTRADLNMSGSAGGLVVVGSYVPRTTRQVEALLQVPGITSAEISVPTLLDDERRPAEIERISQLVDRALSQGQDVVIYTSRKLITTHDADSSLAIGQQVSDGLIAILRSINTQPRYLVAKGGITSSDVATKALDVTRAMVRGQILPGVPLWELGPESRYPGMPYIVFPGNVGGPGAIAQVITEFRAD